MNPYTTKRTPPRATQDIRRAIQPPAPPSPPAPPAAPAPPGPPEAPDARALLYRLWLAHQPAADMLGDSADPDFERWLQLTLGGTQR